MKAKLYKSEKGHYYLVHKDKSSYDPGYMIGSSFYRIYENGSHKLSLKNCQEIELDESPQQTEWDVEIDSVPYFDGDFSDDGKTHIVEPKWRYFFDHDGCLILKRV